MRCLLAATLLWATAAAPMAAQDFGMSSHFGLQAKDQFGGHVEGRAGTMFGGVRGATLDDPERMGRLDVYVGVRPQLGTSRIELQFSQAPSQAPRLALRVNRPLGRRAALKARLDLDAGVGSAASEAEASLALTPRTNVRAIIGGALTPDGPDAVRLRLSAARRFAPGGAMEFAVTDASRAASRASLSLGLRF